MMKADRCDVLSGVEKSLRVGGEKMVFSEFDLP